MDSVFVHDYSVIEYAYMLVKEYDDHQKEQDRITRAKKSGKGLTFTKGRWYSDSHIKHGMSSLPEYKVWQGMKARCFNPNNKNYADYGGRGITVCDEWKKDFKAFIQFVQKRPDSSYSIDRIDNDGNYEPGNVRWATKKQQVNNRRCSTNANI